MIDARPHDRAMETQATSVLTTSLEANDNESVVRQRHTMYVLFAAAWFTSVGLTALYVFAFDSPSWALFLMMGVATAIVLASRPLRDLRFSHYWFLPGIWALTAITFYSAIFYNQPVLAMYMLLPGIFLAIFFWYEHTLTAMHLLIMSALYCVCYISIGGDVGLREAVITTPMFASILMLLGYLGAHANRLGVERSKFESTISSLLVALQTRDGQAADCAKHVGDLSTRVARRFALNDGQLRLLQDAARLHDVGKIGIPNELLSKPSSLTTDEWKVMRTHPEIGERIVATVPGFDDVAIIVRHTHERWDGKGYPDGLCAHEIPLASRIIFACDAYEAMISDRPFRPAMTPEQACAQLRKGAGSEFDEHVVNQLLDILEDSSAAGASNVLPFEPRAKVA